MNHQEDDKATLAALRAAPTEVSMEQVRSMVATFPLAVGVLSWLIGAIKFNLNTILMSSSAILIIGASAILSTGRMSEERPATARDLPAVAQELPAAEALPEPEPAVVFEQPTPKKATPPPPQELSLVACTVANTDQPQPSDEKTVEWTVPAYTDEKPISPSAPEGPKTNMERTFELRDFIGIKVASSMDVTLEVGDFSVTANGDEDALAHLDVRVKDHVLELDFTSSDRSRRSHEPVHFTVRLPVVRTLTVMGSGSVNGPELPPTAHLDLNVLGSGSIILARLLDATTLNLLVEGSGSIDLEDVVRTERAQVNVMGSGMADINRIGEADGLHIQVAGSGIANCRQVNVTGKTAMNITGSGQVNTTGRTDRIEVTLIGSGDVMAKELKAKGGKVIITGSGDASVYCDGPLELLTIGTGAIHTSGSAGRIRSRGVEDDDR